MSYKIYSRGICKPNPGPGVWGFLILNKNNKVEHTDVGKVNSTTSIRIEFQAFLHSIKSFDSGDQIDVFTVSQPLTETWNRVIPRCMREGWTTAKGEPLANMDLILELYEQRKKHPKLKMSWIKGDSKNEWRTSVQLLCEEHLMG
jgi:ribonuclease HI